MKFTITDMRRCLRTPKTYKVKGKKELFEWILHITDGAGFEDSHDVTERSTVDELIDAFNFYANYSYEIKRG